jgi:hypothetical protein
MRHVPFLLGLCLFSTSTVFAQAEYFLNGETEVGGGVSLLSGDSQSGFGTGVEVLFSPTLGLTLNYSRSTFEPTEEVGGESFEVSGGGIGIQLYPSRQGIGGPLTIGLGLGVGRSEGVDTFNATILLARAIASTGDSPVLLFVPKVEAGLTAAFAGGRTASALALAAGIGIAVEVAPGAFAFLEPTAALAIGEEGGAMLGATFGVGVSI